MKQIIKGIAKGIAATVLDETIKRVLEILRSRADGNLEVRYLIEEIKDRHEKAVAELRKQRRL